MTVLSKDGENRIMQLLQPSTSHQAVSISTVSAQSAALSQSGYVELYCDTTCFVATGSDPIATTSGIPVYGGIPRTLKVSAGEKIAAITAAGTDTLRITEMV